MKLLEESKIEASKITNYLLSVEVGNKEAVLYAEALNKLNIILEDEDEKIFKMMLNKKWKMASIDAILAFKKPQSNIRRKIFIMLSILEASPNYTSYFLSKDFSFFDYIKICCVGIRSIIRVLIGFFYLKILNFKY